MAVMIGRTSLAASGFNDNIYAGRQFEFANSDGRFSFGFSLDTGTQGDVEIDIFCAGDTLGDRIQPGPTNRVPVIPDDVLVRGLCTQGDRIVARARNSAVATRVVIWAVWFDEAM